MTRTEYLQTASIQLAVAMLNNGMYITDNIGDWAVSLAVEMANKIDANTAEVAQKEIIDITDQELMLKTRAISIRSTNLSTRVINALRCNQIETVEDLLRYSGGLIMCFRNFGRHSYDELCRWMNRNGYKLQSLPPMWVPYGNWRRCHKTDMSEERLFDTEREADAFCERENKRIMGL